MAAEDISGHGFDAEFLHGGPALCAPIGMSCSDDAAGTAGTVLRPLHDALHQIADTVPALITACGAIVAAFSQPAMLARRKAPAVH